MEKKRKFPKIQIWIELYSRHKNPMTAKQSNEITKEDAVDQEKQLFRLGLPPFRKLQYVCKKWTELLSMQRKTFHSVRIHPVIIDEDPDYWGTMPLRKFNQIMSGTCRCRRPKEREAPRFRPHCNQTPSTDGETTPSQAPTSRTTYSCWDETAGSMGGTFLVT